MKLGEEEQENFHLFKLNVAARRKRQGNLFQVYRKEKIYNHMYEISFDQCFISFL
jgi:hypothetical protein